MIKAHLKGLLTSIFIALLFGYIGNLLGGNTDNFNSLIKPSFAPAAIVFPIVWTILYILMGISSYIIYQSNSKDKSSALIIYATQLIVNSFWSLFFFRLEWLAFSFLWLLLLLSLVIIMINKFYKINKIAAYLQTPYLLWLIFAGILNFSIYILN